MSVVTYKGIIKQGRVTFKNNVKLPDNTIVYVIVPSKKRSKPLRMMSPRLANPAQKDLLKVEVIEESTDANL